MADKDKAPQVIDGEHRLPLVTICRDYEIPGIAGSSADGNTVYIDRRVSKTLRLSNGRDMKLDHPLAVHEVVEKSLVDRFGLAYDHAHYIAYAAERRAVELAGDIWEEYDSFMMNLIQECYDWEYTDLPPDYDVYPHIGIHGGNPADKVTAAAVAAGSGSGIEFKLSKKSKKVIVECFDGGKLVGYAHFVRGSDFLEADDSDGRDAVWVRPDHRRLGIADQMYDSAEQNTGWKIIPSEHLSGAGQQFWEQRLKRLPKDHPAHDWF